MKVFKKNQSISGLVRLAQLFLVATLSACANSQSTIISDDDRTSETQYDGIWIISFAKAARVQPLPGNFEVNCHGDAFEVTAVIRQGLMKFSTQSGNRPVTNHEINLNDAGKFRTEWSFDSEASTTGSASVTLSKPKQKFIFQGRLRGLTGRGRFTTGIEQFGYEGCQQSVSMTRA